MSFLGLAYVISIVFRFIHHVQMRREILELVFFGMNTVEVIPPGLDDADQSPNFQVGII